MTLPLLQLLLKITFFSPKEFFKSAEHVLVTYMQFFMVKFHFICSLKLIPRYSGVCALRFSNYPIK